MKTLFCALVFAVVASIARADRDPPTLGARVIASEDGAHFLLVLAASDRMENWIWTVYSVSPKGIFKEFWSSDGVNGREMFLASDGIHVVCVESWPLGRMTDNDVVIAVYVYGKLLKAYRTIDVVKDPGKIETSVSHYRWLAEHTFIHSNGALVFFTTIDGKDYTLDMITGELTWNLK